MGPSGGGSRGPRGGQSETPPVAAGGGSGRSAGLQPSPRPLPVCRGCSSCGGVPGPWRRGRRSSRTSWTSLATAREHRPRVRSAPTLAAPPSRDSPDRGPATPCPGGTLMLLCLWSTLGDFVHHDFRCFFDFLKHRLKSLMWTLGPEAAPDVLCPRPAAHVLTQAQPSPRSGGLRGALSGGTSCVPPCDPHGAVGAGTEAGGSM